MFILYMHHAHHEYYHGTFYSADWGNYPYFRAGEGYWLVPGTDPEDGAYGREYPEADGGLNEDDENDEALEYMVDLLDAGNARQERSENA